MKKNLNLFVALTIILGVFLCFSCTNSKNTIAEEQEGIQIDPELKELGELNVKLLEYDEIDIPRNGVVPVKKKGKWGLVKKDCNEILSCKYDQIMYGEDEDVWIVKKNDSIGVVDNNGSFVNKLNREFKSYRCLGEGLLYAIQDGAIEHQFIIPIKYEGVALLGDIINSTTSFYNGVIMTEWAGNFKLWSYHDGTLSVISDQYQYFTSEVGEGLYCVTNGWQGKYGFINSKGEVAIPFEFDNPCGAFSDGMASYTDSTDLVGFINRSGEIVIPAQYNYAENFSDGLAYVCNEDTACFIDKEGKVVIDTKGKYSSGGGFIKGFCIVVGESELMGIINKRGDFVVPPEYVINSLSDDVYVAYTSEDNPKYGAFSYDGKQIISFDYDDLSDFHNGWALARIGDIQLIVNKEGKTGLLNIEEVLTIKEKEQEQANVEGQAELEENIKRQIVKLINDENGWEVLSGPSAVWNLQKVSNGIYKAEFTQETQYENMDYEIRNIEVDESGKVLGLETKRVSIRPKANKPEGTMNVDEIIDRQIGRIRR